MLCYLDTPGRDGIEILWGGGYYVLLLFVMAWRLSISMLAMSGLVIFSLFFIVAVSGLLLTTGDNPVLDPAKVRLSEKLLQPFSRVDTSMVGLADRPFFNIWHWWSNNFNSQR